MWPKDVLTKIASNPWLIFAGAILIIVIMQHPMELVGCMDSPANWQNPGNCL